MKNQLAEFYQTLYHFISLDDHNNVYYLLDENGFLHHDELPAVVMVEKTGTNLIRSRREFYFTHGLLYRKNAPAEIYHYLMPRAKNTLKHIENKYYCYNESGQLKNKSHLLDENYLLAVSKSVDWASNINFYNSGCFRDNGPQWIHFYSNGNEMHIYGKNNERHREDGPAVIVIDENKESIHEEWYLEGVKLEP